MMLLFMMMIMMFLSMMMIMKTKKEMCRCFLAVELSPSGVRELFEYSSDKSGRCTGWCVTYGV